MDIKLFLTHFHWDHIQGMPFFAPIYGPKNQISFYTGVPGRPLQETLEGQMAKPYFPVDFGQVAARRNFNHDRAWRICGDDRHESASLSR